MLQVIRTCTTSTTQCSNGRKIDQSLKSTGVDVKSKLVSLLPARKKKEKRALNQDFKFGNFYKLLRN